MDNEPEFWDFESADVFFNAQGSGSGGTGTPGWAFLANGPLGYGVAAKTVDPTAQVMGPVISSVWPLWDPDEVGNDGVASPYGSNNPNAATCAGVPCPFYQYYLTSMAQYQAETGVRPLDYFNVHYYPDGIGGNFSLGGPQYPGCNNGGNAGVCGVPLTDGVYYPAGDEGVLQPSVSEGDASAEGGVAGESARLRATRALWDPTYTTEDWEGYWFPTTYGVPQIIRNMKSWISQYYPGTKTAITEYNFGGTTSSSSGINAAMTQADIFGIFGREGLDLATIWGPPTSSSSNSIGAVFKLFLNYNGAGGRFGNVSVSSTSTVAADSVLPGTGSTDGQYVLAVYGAQRSSDNALTLVVVNKSIVLSQYPYSTSAAEAFTAPITIQNFTPNGTSATVYQMLSGHATTIAAEPAATLTDVPAPAGSGQLDSYTLNYMFPANSVTLLVIPGAAVQGQAINFTAPASPVTYGVAPITLAAIGGPSDNPVTFSVLSGPGSISGNTLTITDVGTVVVAADQAGSAGYSAATEVTQSIVVNQASQTIAFTPLASPVTYGVAPITLAATGGSSGNPVTFSVLSGPGSVSGNLLSITGAGTVVVAADQAGNTEYTAATEVTQSIVVNQANLTVTANSITEPFGTTPVLTAAITGFVNGDGLSAVSGAPALSTTATAASLPGSYPISIGQGTLSAANYSFTLIGGTVTVTFTATAPSKGTLCNGAYSGTFNGNLTVTAGQTCVFVGGAVTGNIQQSGGTVEIIQSTVDGNLQVTGGGIFTVTSGSTVKGNLQVQSIPAGPATNLVCGSSVDGNLQYQNNGTAVLIGAAAPASCPGNLIDGNLTIQSNSAPASATGNTVKGNLTLQSNTAAAGAVDNTVKGNLTVQSNTADTVVDGNTVSGNLQDQSNTAATQVFTNIVGGNLQCQSNTTITGGGNTAKSKQGQCSAF